MEEDDIGGSEQTEDITEDLRTFALQNAVDHDGKANIGPIMGKIMASRPDLRSRAKEISSLAKEAVREVNGMSPEEQTDLLREMAPSYFEKEEKREQKVELPPLEGVEDGVVMRFAPGPSGPLHIGHTRAVILNDEYVKRYGGKLIIRLEDTNPEKIDPDAYDSIIEDIDWLEVDFRQVAVQSDRFDIYIDHTRQLIELGKAYVCTCDVEEWRELKIRKRACPHRDLDPGTHLTEWRKMLDGSYRQNEASLVVKTDLDHKNPAVRDFVAMRINETPHPRTRSEYRVYPLYNFSVVVDDHLMGCTHILRGKDHLNNTERQKYVYRYFGWNIPHFHHYGWVSIKDTLLKTSLIKEGISRGEYDGWADMRLGTLKALAKRGIRPEAIREYWKRVGIKPVDVQFSWKNLYAYNKDIVDPEAKRFFFVKDPIPLRIDGVRRLTGDAPIHPDREEAGSRTTRLSGEDGIRVLVDGGDAEWIRGRLGKGGGGEKVKIRLKDLCNIVVSSFSETDGIFISRYVGNDLDWLKEGAKIIHWVPREAGKNLPCKVYRPDGEIQKGRVEKHVTAADGEVVQFERYGFVSVEIEDGEVNAYFTHT